MNKLRWGILATGRIASVFAKGVLGSKQGELAAVASRKQEEAEKFGVEKWGDFLKGRAVRRHGSYEALLADSGVEAVYIATPHPMHAYWAIRCLEAGKHVLCEKPISMNHAEAMVIFETARRCGRFAMEAFMYRCHPQIAKVVESIRAGAIGEVRAIQANFSFNAGNNWEGRLLANELGGGGILDVGGYCTSMVRLLAGAGLGKLDVVEPAEMKALGTLTPTGVDAYAAAVLKFPAPPLRGPILATMACGVQVGMENVIRVYGSAGAIRMDRWVPGDKGNKFTLCQDGKEALEVACDAEENVYALEADRAAECIGRGELEAAFPAMSWRDTLGNMKTLDRWRAEIGQVYESEKPERQTKPVHGGELRVRDGSFMMYVHVAGVEKPISRLVMGADNQVVDQMPHAAAMFDDYFERGGNTFDTAWLYQGGQCERALGWWMRSRGVRETVVILGKGCHTPECNPAALVRQLGESLERLQTDYVDIYMMHRDNLEVPVGEFVEVLNAQRRAGRMRAFGGSNWTVERIDAFNAYAREKGLTGMAAVSNNFSLARMVRPVWAGCVASSEPRYREWHARTQMTLMPWSSQGRGFFVVGDPDDKSDAMMVNAWYAEDNFRRLERARELAKRRGELPIQIALAYVLHQPFLTIPLIGPRAIEETRTSFEALKISLTAEEMRWLNLET